MLSQLLKNAGITDTLSVDSREIAVESVIKAIREAFLGSRAKALTTKLSDQVVQAAFRKVMDQEEK